jgi:hypothetical protein
MRLRREWTNLGTLIALHSDIVVSDPCDRAFASERGFQKVPQPLRQGMRAHVEFAERSGIDLKDLEEAFVRSQKTRLGKIAWTHPGLHFSQWDTALFVSLCQWEAMIWLASIAPLASVAAGALRPTAA